MYEELVKRLRNRANGSYEEKCEGCEFTEDFPPCVHCTIKAFNDAADAIEDLIAALTASNEVIAKNKPCWISATEKLPEENGYYLTYVESAIFPNSYYFNMIKFIDGNFIEDHCVIHRVTHWQPLPEPPKEET